MAHIDLAFKLLFLCVMCAYSCLLEARSSHEVSRHLSRWYLEAAMLYSGVPGCQICNNELRLLNIHTHMSALVGKVYIVHQAPYCL